MGKASGVGRATVAGGGRSDGEGVVVKGTSINTSWWRDRGTTLVRRGRKCGCGSS